MAEIKLHQTQRWLRRHRVVTLHGEFHRAVTDHKAQLANNRGTLKAFDKLTTNSDNVPNHEQYLLTQKAQQAVAWLYMRSYMDFDTMYAYVVRIACIVVGYEKKVIPAALFATEP